MMSFQHSMGSMVLVIGIIGIFCIKRKSGQGIDKLQRRTSFNKLLALIDEHEAQFTTVRKESEFPPDWWTSKELLDLERRAIFAKMPIALAHASQFQQPGSYKVFEHPSGYPIFLVLGKDLILRGFHNVCRHRAYPVVSTKQSGCTPVLACRYHGWTYNLRGELVKAPKFDGIESFEKKENSLFEVDVRVDSKGVVFINVGALPSPRIPLNVSKFSKGCVEFWEVEAAFNWKLTELADVFGFSQLMGKNHGKGRLQALFDLVSPKRELGYDGHSTLTEITHLGALDTSIVVQVRPIEPERCAVRCTAYYSSKTPNASSLLEHVKQQLTHSTKLLEDCHTQMKTMAVIPEAKRLSTILGWIESHRKEEASAGRVMWPASEVMATARPEDSVLDILCRDLEESGCDSEKGGKRQGHSNLAW